jgi:hypothetical protein
MDRDPTEPAAAPQRGLATVHSVNRCRPFDDLPNGGVHLTQNILGFPALSYLCLDYWGITSSISRTPMESSLILSSC